MYNHETDAASDWYRIFLQPGCFVWDTYVHAMCIRLVTLA